jgi:hypothetical protein
MLENLDQKMKKAAIIGAIAGAGMGILGIIPFVGCVNCVLMFLLGVAIVHLLTQEFGKSEMKDSAIYGAIGGGCAALTAGIISLPIMLIFGTASSIALLRNKKESSRNRRVKSCV